MEPRLISYGAFAQLSDYYPKEAMHAGVETLINVRLTLDSGGSVVDVEPIDPTPQDIQWGFPEAAVTLAKTLKFEIPPDGVLQTRLKVKFALDK